MVRAVMTDRVLSRADRGIAAFLRAAGAMCLVIALAACAPAAGPEAPAATPAEGGTALPVSGADQALFNALVARRVNAARAAAGLPALRPDPRLTQLSAEHAAAMARLGRMAHDLPVPGKGSMLHRVRGAGLSFRAAAENIARQQYYDIAGQPVRISATPCPPVLVSTGAAAPRQTYEGLAATVVARWLASPAHRRNLLEPRMRRIGTGLAVDPDGPGCGAVYVTQKLIG